LQRRLAALAEIASDGTVTQRSLASRLDVSLGLANALLRGLENGGLIKTGPAVMRRAYSGASPAVKRSAYCGAGPAVKRSAYCGAGAPRAKEASRYAITRAGRGAMQRMSRAFAAEAAALLRKSLGSQAKVARLLSARRPVEAKRGR
jgi:DNA-binding Lrp family transcriptional regulator